MIYPFEVIGPDTQTVIEATGASKKSKIFDCGAVWFVVDSDGTEHEQWFTPDCGHAVIQPDCSICLNEQEEREKARKCWVEMTDKYVIVEVIPFSESPQGAVSIETDSDIDCTFIGGTDKGTELYRLPEDRVSEIPDSHIVSVRKL